MVHLGSDRYESPGLRGTMKVRLDLRQMAWISVLHLQRDMLSVEGRL